MQTTDTFNILRKLSLLFNSQLNETKEGCFLSVNNTDVNGDFKAVKLFPGLEILTINAHIKSGFEINDFFNQTEALHFIYCFEGTITHKFSSENETKDIHRLQNVILGGNVHIMKGAQLGIKSTVHQNQTIGSYTMIGMNSVITKKKIITPGYIFYGKSIKKVKKNILGLKRNNINSELLKKENIRFKKLVKIRK